MNVLIQRRMRLAVGRDGVVGRRDFLRAISAAGLAGGALGWTDTVSLHAEELRRRGMACILLWMAGGPSQFETFDPKPEHANGGETKAIATNVPGIRIAENLPRLAQVADRLAIVRSMSTREGEHQRASYLMRTSHLPLPSVQHPTLGAVAAHEIADLECELPAFVQIGGFGPGGGGGGGFLGAQYDAFNVFPGGRVPENSRPSTDTGRFRDRLALLGRLQQAASPERKPGTSEHELRYASASRMILSPQMQAFELEQEPAAIREGYGMGHANSTSGAGRAGGMRAGFGIDQFASSCLLARRLVEAGVTFVEATVPQWDTHDDNFARCRSLCETMDQPLAYLITDLEQRGLLDKTLVIWMGEFGRSPRINPRAGRDHFPRGFSVVLAGGGVRGGRVIGATDAGGETIADRPVSERDLFQTFYKAMGIDARKEHLTAIGRPIKFVDGGEPLNELFA